MSTSEIHAPRTHSRFWIGVAAVCTLLLSFAVYLLAREIWWSWEIERLEKDGRISGIVFNQNFQWISDFTNLPVGYVRPDSLVIVLWDDQDVALLSRLSEFTNIEGMTLSAGGVGVLTPAGLRRFRDLPKVTKFMCFKDDLTDAHLNELGRYRSLRQILLSSAAVTPNALRKLIDISQLNEIDLAVPFRPSNKTGVSGGGR